jgi:hypothetical protein
MQLELQTHAEMEMQCCLCLLTRATTRPELLLVLLLVLLPRDADAQDELDCNQSPPQHRLAPFHSADFPGNALVVQVVHARSSPLTGP